MAAAVRPVRAASQLAAMGCLEELGTVMAGLIVRDLAAAEDEEQTDQPLLQPKASVEAPELWLGTRSV